MMLIVGDITWHAENVAFCIKRMHQLQKKVENAILDLDKEANGTPYGVTDKFGIENLNLLEAIDRIAHADEEEMRTVSEGYNRYMDKFCTHDKYSAQRANLAHVSLALEWGVRGRSRHTQLHPRGTPRQGGRYHLLQAHRPRRGGARNS